VTLPESAARVGRRRQASLCIARPRYKIDLRARIVWACRLRLRAKGAAMGGATMAIDEERSSVDVIVRHLADQHLVDFVLLDGNGAQIFAKLVAARARALGGAKGDALLHWVNLHVALGIDFMNDPQLASLRAEAGDSLTGGHPRVLVNAARSYLLQTAGATGLNYQRALVRASRLSSSKIVDTRVQTEDDALEILQSIYPEKVRWMGGTGGLLPQAKQAVTELGLEGVPPLYLVLMLLLGSGFAQDPRYRWAAAAPAQSGRLHVGPRRVLESLEAGAREALRLALHTISATSEKG
jgi:hypothetical protein